MKEEKRTYVDFKQVVSIALEILEGSLEHDEVNSDAVRSCMMSFVICADQHLKKYEESDDGLVEVDKTIMPREVFKELLKEGEAIQRKRWKA